ncbi:hypothetical protein RUND412_006584 [Rhizina undulata]
MVADAHTRREAEEVVKSWGFGHVFTWTDSPNFHYPPHKHPGLTTHLILSGTLTISFPDEGAGGAEKKVFGPGERIDVGQDIVHEVWIGEEGCEYVIGEK